MQFCDFCKKKSSDYFEKSLLAAQLLNRLATVTILLYD